MRALRVVVLIACACGGSQRPGATEPELVVLEPGAEPRQQLRYAPLPGTSQRVEIDVKVRLDSTFTNTVLEQGHTAADSPTVRSTLRLTSQPVQGERDVEVRFVTEDVTVLDDTTDPRLRKRVEAVASGAKGARGSWRVSPSGRITAVDVAVSPDTSATMRRQLATLRETIETSSLPYPDVPIGIGARWRATQSQRRANATWTTSATYTLRGADRRSGDDRRRDHRECTHAAIERRAESLDAADLRLDSRARAVCRTAARPAGRGRPDVGDRAQSADRRGQAADHRDPPPRRAPRDQTCRGRTVTAGFSARPW